MLFSELLLAEEEVVAARPPRPAVERRVVAETETDQLGEPRQDLPDEGAFARAGRTGDDDESGDDRS